MVPDPDSPDLVGPEAREPGGARPRSGEAPRGRSGRHEEPPVEPFGVPELAASRRRPDQLVALVLAAPERLAANVAKGLHLTRLMLLLLFVSALAAVPYGAVLGFQFSWRIAVLYLGSTLICFPALHVFCSYVGARVSLGQSLTLALTIPAVAALFTFGFAPILAFLRATLRGGGRLDLSDLSIFLLTVALLAGVGQLWRCVIAARELTLRPVFPIVLIGWHVVFFYVVTRMGQVLELG